MDCPNCGTQLENNATVCTICGTKMIQDEVLEQKQYELFAVFGFLFAFIALLFLPPLFGVLGIWFGYMVRKRDKRTLGLVLMIVSAVCMVVGMIIGAIAGMNL